MFLSCTETIIHPSYHLLQLSISLKSVTYCKDQTSWLGHANTVSRLNRGGGRFLSLHSSMRTPSHTARCVETNMKIVLYLKLSLLF